jgi:hypothetical protein
MYNREHIIREYLKKLTVEDIADSVYLFGIDFDSEPLDSIMSALSGLFEEVQTLRGMINRDFEPQNGELLPKSYEVQSGIIEDCYRKESALLKILSCKEVYDEFVIYKTKERLEETSPSR